MSKAFNISNATTRVAPELLKGLAILSDTTVRRSAADQNYTGNQKKGLIFLRDQQFYYGAIWPSG